MWRFKAPLSGRSGEIHSTDGPSRLNISVTLFPNCVVVPEAGTAVRAKQRSAELRASGTVYGIHINMPVSHGLTILSARKWCCRLLPDSALRTLFVPICWVFTFPISLPSSLGQVQSVCCLLDCLPLSSASPPLYPAQGVTSLSHKFVCPLCCAHTDITGCVPRIHRPRTPLQPALLWLGSLSTLTLVSPT